RSFHFCALSNPLRGTFKSIEFYERPPHVLSSLPCHYESIPSPMDLRIPDFVLCHTLAAGKSVTILSSTTRPAISSPISKLDCFRRRSLRSPTSFAENTSSLISSPSSPT